MARWSTCHALIAVAVGLLVAGLRQYSSDQPAKSRRLLVGLSGA
jgi:hypothetical protein